MVSMENEIIWRRERFQSRNILEPPTNQMKIHFGQRLSDIDHQFPAAPWIEMADMPHLEAWVWGVREIVSSDLISSVSGNYDFAGW